MPLLLCIGTGLAILMKALAAALLWKDSAGTVTSLDDCWRHTFRWSTEFWDKKPDWSSSCQNTLFRVFPAWFRVMAGCFVPSIPLFKKALIIIPGWIRTFYAITSHVYLSTNLFASPMLLSKYCSAAHLPRMCQRPCSLTLSQTVANLLCYAGK